MGTFSFEENKYGINNIPTSQQMYKPILLRLTEAGVSSNKEIYDYIATYFKLSEDALSLKIADGKIPIFYSRFNYALWTLNNKCLIQRLFRGMYDSTGLGEWCVEQYCNYDVIDISWIPNFLIDKYGHRCPVVIAEKRWWSFIDSLGLSEDGEEILCGNQKYQDIGYPVSIEELFDIYKSDSNLRDILRKGRFTYVDGYLARVHIRWNENEEGRALSWLSDSNEEEYLGFIKDRHTGLVRYSGIIRRSRLRNPYLLYKISCFIHPWGEADDPHTRRRIDSWVESLPREAHDALTFLMKECKVRRGRLADILEVTSRTILRWTTGETPMRLENLIAICLAIQLPSKISFALISKFNAKDADGEYFKPEINEKHLFWEMLLDTFHTKEPREINGICKKKGFDIIFTEYSDVYNEHPRHEYIRSK